MDFDPYKYFAGKMGLLFQKLLYVTDLTEEDLAKNSGVSMSTVRSVLKGDHLSRMKTYDMIAKAIGTSVQELYDVVTHMGADLDEYNATIMAFGLISNPATRIEIAKILNYMAEHPGTKKEDLIRLLGLQDVGET